MRRVIDGRMKDRNVLTRLTTICLALPGTRGRKGRARRSRHFPQHQIGEPLRRFRRHKARPQSRACPLRISDLRSAARARTDPSSIACQPTVSRPPRAFGVHSVRGRPIATRTQENWRALCISPIVVTCMGVADGDRSFESWYRAEHPRLVTSLLLVCGDLSDAQDAADEALASALARWSRVGAMASPGGWTYRVAINVLRRRGRRRTLETRALRRVAHESHVPAPAGEAWEAVRQLPARQREAVVLRYIGDLTEQDVARVMGIRRGTVSATLADALRNLAQLLDDESGVEVNCA